MSLLNVATILQKRLKDNWNATPIAWDNVAFTPQRNKSWIRFQLTQASAVMVAGDADASVHRESGLITISVFTPLGDGPQSNYSFCDTLCTLFRNYSTNFIYCQSPYVVRVGEEEEWFHQNVWIPFYHDNCFEEVI